MIKRLSNWLINAQQKSLAEHFKRVKPGSVPSNNIILVQCVEDLYCFGLFGQIVTSLRATQPFRVEQYVLRSLRVGESKSLFIFLISRLLINPLHNFKWVRLYNSFCDGVGYRSTSFRPIVDLIDFFRAWVCWKNLADKNSLINMKIDGIAVGDLINDSYIRFKPAPTVNLKDKYLLVLLWQAYRDVRRAQSYFARAKPKLYLTSYSTYIQHGIPVRVALQNGTRVFSFGSYQEFTKELTVEDWVHTKNPDGYASEFSQLDKQDERLVLAEAALSSRLSGGVDSATAYMRKSAYLESGESVPDVRDAFVIFLHDFYDSPHVYREMVFPDFWEWVCFTIETLKKANIRFYLKSHPNQINLSDQVLGELKKRYPGLPMIPSYITNKQLVNAGMSCAITVYGTVAHEMAYLGVPTISCSRHPHVSFNFCRTARNKAEYNSFLNTSVFDAIDGYAMRRESLIFYYMHNLYLSDDIKTLKDTAMMFRMDCGENDGQNDLVEKLKAISALSGYKSILGRMAME